MDSKNILISSQHRLTGIDWSELIHVDLDHETANEFKIDKVSEHAHALFDEPEVYVVIGRHDSHLAHLDDALGKVSTYLKTSDVTLCNTSFTKAMKFAKIGVMAFGQKHK
jgi:hypothetical protein